MTTIYNQDPSTNNTRDSTKISGLISELQKVLNDHGDLPVVSSDAMVGYPSTFMVDVMESSGYNEDGYYEFTSPTKKGTVKLCVLGYND